MPDGTDRALEDVQRLRADIIAKHGKAAWDIAARAIQSTIEPVRRKRPPLRVGVKAKPARPIPTSRSNGLDWREGARVARAHGGRRLRVVRVFTVRYGMSCWSCHRQLAKRDEAAELSNGRYLCTAADCVGRFRR